MPAQSACIVQAAPLLHCLPLSQFSPLSTIELPQIAAALKILFSPKLCPVESTKAAPLALPVNVLFTSTPPALSSNLTAAAKLFIPQLKSKLLLPLIVIPAPCISFVVGFLTPEIVWPAQLMNMPSPSNIKPLPTQFKSFASVMLLVMVWPQLT